MFMPSKEKNFRMVWVIGSLLITSSMIIFHSVETQSAEPSPVMDFYIAHAPIRIDSNLDFTSVNGISGGDGSLDRPWLIENLYINGSETRNSGILIQNTTDYFIIRNCRLTVSIICISLYGVSNGTIENNILENNFEMAILCANSKVEITDNIISNNIGAGIYLLNSSQTFISSNSFVSNDDADIILGQGSKNIAITKNNFTSGILIEVDKIDEFTSFEIDKSNRIFNKTIYYFKNETGLIVPQDAGQIILANCTEIIIENQQISYAHGITLGFSDFNIINNNVLSSNKNAILLINSTFNQIYNNIVRNNHFGILIIRSYNNTLFHNTFIDNTYHTSQGGNNKWDNGYPSGGNYWDDYNGTDEYSGQNQDQPGSDGIGDTPYIVNGQNVDNYPLMEPYNAENPPTPGNETYVWATVITIVAIASVLGIIYWKKRRKRHGLP